MLARVFSKVAVLGVAVALGLGGVVLSSSSAGALGDVATFCNTNVSFPAEPHVGSNPSPAQYRAIERYGLRVATLLHGYIVLSPTTALAQEFAIASNALRAEVAILKNEVALKERYHAIHRDLAARNALIVDVKAIVKKEIIYSNAIDAINTLATQECTPPSTTTTVATTTTTVPNTTTTTSTSTTTTTLVTTTTQ
jgi:hypothetical protein